MAPQNRVRGTGSCLFQHPPLNVYLTSPQSAVDLHELGGPCYDIKGDSSVGTAGGPSETRVENAALGDDHPETTTPSDEHPDIPASGDENPEDPEAENLTELAHYLERRDKFHLARGSGTNPKSQNGSLGVSVNLRFLKSDYATLHVPFYAYGIGVDDTRTFSYIIFALSDILDDIAVLEIDTSEESAPALLHKFEHTDLTDLAAAISSITNRIHHVRVDIDGSQARRLTQTKSIARCATTPPSSSKVNSTLAKWIMEQVKLLLKSKLMGVGKNAQKPITVLVVAAYKEQVVDLKMRFLDLARELDLDDEQRSRVRFKTVDNSQGDEADFVFIDLVATTTPGFVTERHRLTLGYSRSTEFHVVIARRGSFVGHETKLFHVTIAMKYTKGAM
ncbi:hypothetical protein HG530_004381 [Fusarium avenaceum]|nr:hypothetical protein HG530_004381 [Fusarium avenaceum]